MTHTILRLPAVKDRTGLSRSTLYSRIADGTFPTPINLGGGGKAAGRAVGWIEAEVEEWIARQIERSRSSAPERRR